MKRKLALALLMLLALSDCVAWQKVVWPSLVTCAGPVSSQLVQDIEAILAQGGSAQELSDAAVDALEKLAAENGATLVACVIEQLIDKWLAPNGIAASADAQAKAARAQNFLNDRGVTVRSE
jgi:hypothetical protein